VVALEVEGREMVEGGAIRLAGKVVNHGPERALTVALHIDGRVADRKVVDIAPGGEGVVSFVLRDLEAGSHRVELVLKKDWYQADDRRLAGLRLGAPVSVLLVDGDPRFSLVESETFFLREALRSDRLSSEQPVVTRVVEAGSLAETDLEKFDVVILANVPAPSDGTALVDFVTGGGGLVIFWGANCRAGEYESSLSSILPVRPAEAATAVSGSPFRIGEVNTADRMLSIFRPPGGGSFTTASFYRRAGIAAEMQRGTVTARFSDGSPWMVRGRTGGGEVVFFSSTADLEWNDLPTKPVFVPLLRRVVMEISGEFQDGREAGVEAGEAKVFSGESELAYSTITVVRPDGEIRRQEFVPRQGKVSARFEETDMVGFYSYTGEGREGVFAVNPPAAESDLQPLGAEELESRFQQIPLELRSSGGGEGEEGLFQRGSRSLTRPLLAGLFLLLLVEMVIAGPRRTGGRLPR
jgi:hypothetical protein